MRSISNVNKLESAQAHRRQTLLRFVLPAVGVALGLIVLVVLLIVPGSPLQLRQPAQIGIIADWMLIWFVLCPVVICLFPIYVLFVVLFFGVTWVHNGTARGLRRVQLASQSLAEKTAVAADRLSRVSIGVNARLAFVDKLHTVFMRGTAQEAAQESGKDHAKRQ